jgi:hypothetical protein
MIAILARSLLQSIYKRKICGVTKYYADNFESRIKSAKWQLDRQNGNIILEIGCGRDLHISLVAALLYGKKVIAFDVAPLADIELINYTVKRLGFGQQFSSCDDLRKIGIEYVVGENIDSIRKYDGVVSDATFEHIEESQLWKIFSHSRTNMARCITANIDFKDHWSYIVAVGPVNFYYVKEWTWRLINNYRMFQNRLRYSDFERLVSLNGYRVESVEKSMLNIAVNRYKLANRFSGYETNDLLVGQVMVHWVLD